MKSSIKRFLGVALAACLAAPAAYAAESGTYFTLGTGYGNAREANLGTSSMLEADEIGKSAVFTGAWGTGLSPSLRGELELAYHPDYAIDERLSAAGTAIAVDGEIDATSLMANLYYDFPMHGFTPFVGLGAGASRNQIHDIRNTALDGPYAGLAVIGKGDRTTSFAWQAILGSEIAINGNLSLDVSYHYVDLGDLRTAANSAGGVTEPASEGDLRIHDIRLGLRYRF